ncbi:hypothetical protein H1F59_001183 [Salmonella enterica]|nr:hypothetical protein [Salmonella enterica]EFP4560706.1 hypothetical protein [Salmonella enterica]
MDPGGTETIRQRIDSFAAARATTARTLKAADRKELIIKASQRRSAEFCKSMDTVAQHPGVSRATAYLYVRQPDCELCPSLAGLSVNVPFSLTLVFQFFRELLVRLLAFCPVTHYVI